MWGQIKKIQKQKTELNMYDMQTKWWDDNTHLWHKNLHLF